MFNKRLILLAAGGHGRVVLDLLLELKKNIEGILDPGQPIDSTIFGLPILGGDEWLEKFDPSDFELINGAGMSPGNKLRKNIYIYWQQRGFKFLSLVHPFAKIGRGTTISEGTQVMAGAVVQCRVLVEENVVINTRASIDHDTNIGANTFIGPGAILCGEVNIGKDVFIGAGAVILPGIRVGNEATIGAGAIVTKDVPEMAIMVGNPATKKKSYVK